LRAIGKTRQDHAGPRQHRLADFHAYRAVGQEAALRQDRPRGSAEGAWCACHAGQRVVAAGGRQAARPVRNRNIGAQNYAARRMKNSAGAQVQPNGVV